MGLAHFLQVLVSWKNNSLVVRERIRPSRLACQSANASRQHIVVQWSTAWIEARKFLELDGRAAHHKAVTIICVSLCCRRFSQRSVSLVIFEHRLISESERVAVEMKLRCCVAGVRERDSGKNTEPASSY